MRSVETVLRNLNLDLFWTMALQCDILSLHAPRPLPVSHRTFKGNNLCYTVVILRDILYFTSIPYAINCRRYSTFYYKTSFARKTRINYMIILNQVLVAHTCNLSYSGGRD
jgi:hypothetical protein